MEKLEVITTKFTCPDSDHRFFALEMVGNQESGQATICLACTSCGSLIIHRIDVG